MSAFPWTPLPPLPVPEQGDGGGGVPVPNGNGQVDYSKLWPQPVLPLPLDPAILARSLQSSASRGQFDAPIYRFSGLIPAGATVTVPLSARQGFVGVMLSPVALYSSIHDARIVVTMILDGTSQPTPDGIPMTADLVVSLSQYWLVHYQVVLQVVNTSPFDTIMTLDSQAGVVEKTLFDRYYWPMLQYSHLSLLQVADKIRPFVSGQGGD